MANIVFKDRVWETWTAEAGTTSPITLAGAKVGYQAFSVLNNGDTTTYCITDGNTWEVGLGTYSAGTLSRDVIYSSSNAGAIASFSAGTKDVFLAPPTAILNQINLLDTFSTSEMVSGARAVSFNTSGNIQIAMASVPSRMPAVGVIVDDITSGSVARIYNRGKLNSTKFNFSGYIGSIAWVGTSGEIVVSGAPSLSGNIQQSIGIVTSHSGMLIQPVVSGSLTMSGNIASGQIGVNHLASGLVSGNYIPGTASGGWVPTTASGAFFPANQSGIWSSFSLTSGAVQSGHIGNNAVNSGNIASGQVGVNHLASGLVSGNYIPGTASGGWIPTTASGAFFPANQSGNWVDKALSGTWIDKTSSGVFFPANASGSWYPVKSGAIGSGAVLGQAGGGAFNIASGTIGVFDIGSGAIVSGTIASGQVGQFHIASGAITSGRLGVTGTPDGTKILRDDFTWVAPSAPTINSGDISSGKIASGAVQGFYGSTRHIASGTVGSFDFASGAISSGAIASGQVGFGHLANNSVQSGTIASGTISTFHIASGGVLSGNIASGQIGINHLASGLASGNYIPGTASGGWIPTTASGVFFPANLSGNWVNSTLSGTWIDKSSSGLFYPANASGIWIPVVSGNVGSGAIVGQAGGGRFNIASGTLGVFDHGSGSIVSGTIASGQIGINHLASGLASGNYIPGTASGLFFPANLSGQWVNSTLSGTWIDKSSSGLFFPANASGIWYPVTSGAIGSGAIIGQAGGGRFNIASGTISTFDIGSGAIVSGTIASGQIGINHLASGLVSGAYIPASASGLFGGGSVTSGSLTTYSFASGAAITTAQFVAPFISGTAWTALTEETISGARAVAISQSGNIRIAMAGTLARMPAVGIVVGNVASGIQANVHTVGNFQLTSGMGDYSGYIGKPLIVGRSGQIVTTSGGFGSGGLLSGDVYQSLGVAFNSGNAFINIASTPQFVPAQILSGNIGSGQISSFHIASGSITSGLIGNAAIHSGDIASGAIVGQAGGGSFNIASGTIGAFDIGSGAIVSGTIASGVVGKFHISSGAITSGRLGVTGTPNNTLFLRDDFSWQAAGGGLTSGAVQSGHIASGAIQGFYGATRHIASGTVGNSDFGSGAINSGHLASGLMVQNLVSYFTTAEIVSGGRAVALNDTGMAVLAMSATSGRMPAIGFQVTGALSGATLEVITHGIAIPASGLNNTRPGKPVWVNASGYVGNVSGGFLSGGCSIFNTLLSGTLFQVLGVATHSGAILVQPNFVMGSGITMSLHGLQGF